MADPDRMHPLANIPTLDDGKLPVHRDYDTVMVGAWRLDLRAIAQLQVALDAAVEGIRGYQARQADAATLEP